MMRRMRSAAAPLFMVSALALAGCSGAAAPGPTPDLTGEPAPSQTLPVEPAPQPEPETEPEEPAALTCESIIPAGLVDEFEEAGWSVRPDILRIGSVELVDSVHCVWGDFTTANDLVVVFASGTISPADAATAQQELRDSGWLFEDAGNGVYVTEDPANGLFTSDEDGYGMTYLFGEGWVTFADTKQGLLLVEPPTR